MNPPLQSVRPGCTRAGLLLSIVLMLAGSPSALAQCVSVTVTTQTELEAAVLDYNANCGNGDVLTATVSGTITISGSALSDVNNATTAVFEIVGDGDDILDGGGAFHILDIGDGFVNIDSLTLRNGNHPSLSAGAISNRSAAVLAINNSTFSGNRADSYGGAILSYGATTITNSTFINNAADQASAIQIFRGTTTIQNSTFTGNTGAGVILVFGASSSAVITNSTLSGNNGVLGLAGVVVAMGTVTFQNSIIARNTAGTDCSAQAGGTATFSPGHTNLMDVNGCGTAGVHYLTANPLLGALGNNGGGVQTFALLPGSPAINAGDNAGAAGLSTDARGFPRVVSGTVDLGAFESQQATEVRFVSGSAAGSEATAAPSVLTLTTSDGNNTEAQIMVELTVTGGTPTGDYTLVSPFAIPSGTPSSTPFPIPGFAIVSDVDEEPNEDLTFSLSNASGATLGTPATMVYTIENDDVAPVVVSRSPNDEDNGVAITSSIEITFNEPVQKAATGVVEIFETGVGTFETYDLSVPADSARISVSGSVVTIDPTIDFVELTDYHVLISPGAITNLQGTGFAGYTLATEYDFTTDDATPPQITALTPADNATNVGTNISGTRNLQVAFNEQVGAGVGFISLYRSADDSLVETIDVNAAVRVDFYLNSPTDGGFYVDLQAGLDFATEYYVQIDPGAIVDAANNPNSFPGITDTTTWSFTTDTPPALINQMPPDNEVNVPPDQTLILEFDKPVARGTGNVTLFTASDNQIVEQIAIGGSNVSIGGNAVFTNPSNDLLDLTEYYVLVDDGAIVDASPNATPFAGITTVGAWSFTVGDYTMPTVVTLDPADDSADVPLSQLLTATFDEPIQPGLGAISLYSGSPQVLFLDPLDNASLLNVTMGNFFAESSPAFAPDPILGVNDGMGGGDFGGDTPGDRTTYNGFIGGFLEGNGFSFGSTNPTIIEWQNIDVTGALGLQFNVDLASALRPDTNDSVVFEAIVDGGTPIEILAVVSPALNNFFRTADTGEILSDTAQTFRRAIPATGSNLTIRATLSLSGTDDGGDDIAIDNVTITGNGLGSSTLVEQVMTTESNIMFLGDILAFDPTAGLNLLTDYYVTMEAGAITDTSPNANPFVGVLNTDWSFTTTGDMTPPSIIALMPPDNASNTGVNGNLELTFSESVLAGAGNITIRQSSDDSIVETIAIGAPNVTIIGDTVTVDPVGILLETTEYYVLIDAGAITDASFNAFAGIADSTGWSFTTGDFTGPTLLSLAPADDATGVGINTNLQLLFNEAVQPGMGDITLHLSIDDSVVDTIAVGSAAVTVTGNLVTVNPPTTLAESTEYYVQVAAGAFVDTSPNGNLFPGISSPGDWSFATGEFTAPIIVGLAPANGGANLPVDTNLALVFDENVQAATGDVTLHLASDDSVVETIAIGAANVQFMGDTVLIDPAITLQESTSYYVRISAGAITDTSLNSFPGITDSMTWTFATGDFTSPGLVAVNPADNAIGIATNTNLQLLFDENVQAGAGDITLHLSSDNSVVESIAINSPGVVIAGDTVTVNPASTLAESTEHYVRVAAGAILDTSANANAFAGIADSTSWSFTTGEFTAPEVIALEPADDAVDVATGTSLILTFDENVQPGTGVINVRLTSDDSIVEAISIDSPSVMIIGDTVSIDPSVDLDDSTEYYVQVAAGAITDTSLNAFPGITDATSWSFTTGDFTAPTLTMLNPADNAVDVAIDAVLEMAFDETVRAGSGAFTLHLRSNNTVVEAIPVGAANVIFAGDTVTIDPAGSLANATDYYVQVAATAITDASDNAFAGIADTDTWNFSTGDFVAPEVVTLSPTSENDQVASDTDLTITFDKPVQAGAGTITIFDASDDSIFEAIAVPSAQVMIIADQVRVDPVAELGLGTAYYVNITDGAITDTATAPNSFAGIADRVSWTFTTDDNDGVANDIENQAPNGGDGNFDGIPDRLQPNVASFPSMQNGCFLTLSAPIGTLINHPRTAAVPSNAPTGFEYPCQLVEFALTGVPMGNRADLELFVFPASPSVGAHFTFNHQTDTWENDATAIDTTMGSRRVQRSITDGGPYDADGISDGVITNSGAPAIFAMDRTRPVPLMAPWGLLMLGLVLIVAAQYKLRRS